MQTIGTSPAGDSMQVPHPAAEASYALILSGGGVRATAFHLGLLLRLAAEDRLERVGVISSVSGGRLAVAAPAAIPYMVGFVNLNTQAEGWFSIDPATDEPRCSIAPMRKAVRLWDGGVYENLGLEPVYKPQRGLVDGNLRLLVVGDAS